MNKNKELNHIAFIMDGNRRWAKKRGLPVIAGHHKGAQRIEPLVEYAAKSGIKYITFWAFSSENWGRGEKEVGFIMRVFRELIISSPVLHQAHSVFQELDHLLVQASSWSYGSQAISCNGCKNGHDHH